jgi:hypothetical protein
MLSPVLNYPVDEGEQHENERHVSTDSKPTYFAQL